MVRQDRKGHDPDRPSDLPTPGVFPIPEPCHSHTSFWSGEALDRVAEAGGPGTEHVRHYSDARSVVPVDRVEQSGCGRKIVLREINHHAPKHRLPDADDQLRSDGECLAGPAVLDEAGLPPDVHQQVRAQPRGRHRGTVVVGQGSE